MPLRLPGMSFLLLAACGSGVPGSGTPSADGGADGGVDGNDAREGDGSDDSTQETTEGHVFATVGPAGATLDGGIFTLVFPPGALEAETPITLDRVDGSTVPGDGFLARNTALRFGPEGLSFRKPVHLEIRYQPAYVAQDGGDEGSLRLQKRVGDRWDYVPGTTLDREATTVRGDLSGFSIYGAVSSDPPVLRGFGAPAAVPGRTLDLLGTNMGNDPFQISVFFHGDQVSAYAQEVVSASDERVTVVVPPLGPDTPGTETTVEVFLSVAGREGGHLPLAVHFEGASLSPPDLYSATPVFSVGDRITIDGVGFSKVAGENIVDLAGLLVPAETWQDRPAQASQRITLLAPAGVRSGELRVRVERDGRASDWSDSRRYTVVDPTEVLLLPGAVADGIASPLPAPDAASPDGFDPCDSDGPCLLSWTLEARNLEPLVQSKGSQDEAWLGEVTVEIANSRGTWTDQARVFTGGRVVVDTRPEYFEGLPPGNPIRVRIATAWPPNGGVNTRTSNWVDLDWKMSPVAGAFVGIPATVFLGSAGDEPAVFDASRGDMVCFLASGWGSPVAVQARAPDFWDGAVPLDGIAGGRGHCVMPAGSGTFVATDPAQGRRVEVRVHEGGVSCYQTYVFGPDSGVASKGLRVACGGSRLEAPPGALREPVAITMGHLSWTQGDFDPEIATDGTYYTIEFSPEPDSLELELGANPRGEVPAPEDDVAAIHRGGTS